MQIAKSGSVFVASIVWAVSSFAQSPQPTRIRGTITDVASHDITIAARDGATLLVSLTEPVTVMTVKRIDLSSIKPGTYVGIATRSGSSGMPEAIEVLVFPEAMRGTGEGHYPWDLEPGSMMTNATVGAVVQGTDGPDLTLQYKGDATTIHVPPAVPVVMLAPAAWSDVKAGAPVMLSAVKASDGHLSASRLTVGTNGVVPPM